MVEPQIVDQSLVLIMVIKLAIKFFRFAALTNKSIPCSFGADSQTRAFDLRQIELSI